HSGPFDDAYASTGAQRTVQIEFVDQPLGASKPKPEAATRGPAVGHRQLDICDTRPLVTKRQPDARPGPFGEQHPIHVASAAVDDGVTSQFADGSDQLGLVDQAHAAILSQLSYDLAGDHHVLLDAHRHAAACTFDHFSAIR